MLGSKICLATPVIHALGDGYELYIVTDASGGVSLEAHEMAIQRMVQAGAVPSPGLVFASELQRDWARTATVPGVAQMLVDHMGNVGTSSGEDDRWFRAKLTGRNTVGAAQAGSGNRQRVTAGRPAADGARRYFTNYAFIGTM